MRENLFILPSSAISCICSHLGGSLEDEDTLTREYSSQAKSSETKDSYLEARFSPLVLKKLLVCGYTIEDECFHRTIVDDLREMLQNMAMNCKLKDPKYKELTTKQSESLRIREDLIAWLDFSCPDLPTVFVPLRKLFQRLKRDLQSISIYVTKAEVQISLYKAGSNGYQRHLDAPPEGPHRKITCILYLNPQWTKASGGELLIFTPDGDASKGIPIYPIHNRILLFQSQMIPHMVCPTNEDRFAITLWLSG